MMKKTILVLALLSSLLTNAQMSFDSKLESLDLYVEPSSIQSIKDIWVDDKYDNRRVGVTMVIGGLVMVGLDLYEGKEAWKRPTSNGWTYKPYIQQSTRPFMMATGIALTGTGIGIILYNQ
jgi:hypothetical protein